MDDNSIKDRISALVEREHQLRTARSSGVLSEAAEHDELGSGRVVENYWQ